jgi:hypothetical protein
VPRYSGKINGRGAEAPAEGNDEGEEFELLGVFLASLRTLVLEL